MPAHVRKRKKRSVSISASAGEESTLDYNYANGDAQQKKKVERVKEIPFYGIKTCHSPRKSLFSSTSGFDDYRGFLNLCVVLLIISNARVFLENILKYGILVDPIQWVSAVWHHPYEWPNLVLILMSNGFIYAAYRVERQLVKNAISQNTGIFLHSLNLFIVIVLPPIWTLTSKKDPVASVVSCSVYVIVFLKLWSYAQSNKWYRDDYFKSLAQRKLQRTMSMPASAFNSTRDDLTDIQVKYPYNISIRNLYYFMLAPTLCYEPCFPRCQSINKAYLARRLLEILFLFHLELALIQQWIVPVLRKAILPIHHNEGYIVMERLLKLAIPNHLIWLIFFYFMFHSVLNAIAELMRFADREFYRDWWNSETVVYFWQAWNIPVHKFCVRHVYKPLLSVGVGKQISQLAVFMLSAFFHEYLVSIPLHMFKLWAFAGMIMQVPLSAITSFVTKRFSGHYGNMIVWLSLILGQPIAILAYVYYYYVINYTVEV